MSETGATAASAATVKEEQFAALGGKEADIHLERRQQGFGE